MFTVSEGECKKEESQFYHSTLVRRCGMDKKGSCAKIERFDFPFVIKRNFIVFQDKSDGIQDIQLSD
jgi:hypothetical protein